MEAPNSGESVEFNEGIKMYFDIFVFQNRIVGLFRSSHRMGGGEGAKSYYINSHLIYSYV